jgi:hypothetical protein
MDLATVKKHLDKLDDPRIKQMYELADRVAVEAADTLDDEFQIAVGFKVAVAEYFKNR